MLDRVSILKQKQNKTKKEHKTNNKNQPSEEFANCYFKSGRIKLMKPELRTVIHIAELPIMQKSVISYAAMLRNSEWYMK